MSLLLQAGADVNSTTDYLSQSSLGIASFSTPLSISIQFNKLSILRILLAAEAKVASAHLISAVEGEKLVMVQCLLDKMEWQNDTYNVTRIFESIFNKGNLGLLKLFIKPELINANTILSSGKSLLYHSVEANNLEFCRLLIDEELRWILRSLSI